MNNIDLQSLPKATLRRRITAGIYDLFLIFAVAFLYSMIVTLIANALGYQPTGLKLQESGETMRLVATDEYQPMLNGSFYKLGLYASLVAFYMGFWRTRSATLGMQTWRLRLISVDGSRPSWKQLFIRAFSGSISLTVFGLGFVYALLDKQNRTFHDIMSNTSVVITPKNT